IEVPTDLFIGGQWRAPASGRRIDVINPSNEEVLATVADASVEEAMQAVDAAAAAAPGWAATSPRARADILRRAYELMVRDAD
ncbi:aldehyde dehydrogenase family protein, partial [Klebsiella pneumoniae]